MATAFLVCLMATSFYFQHVLGDIGGRTACSLLARTPTVDAIATSRCISLTFLDSFQSCTTYVTRPALTATPALTPTTRFSGVACPVVLPFPIGTRDAAGARTVFAGAGGLAFTVPQPPTDFLLDLELVTSSNSDRTNYLEAVFTTNPAAIPNVQIVQRAPMPPAFVSQVYSAVLINRNTRAASLPQYFQVDFQSCTVPIVGPNSFTICGGVAGGQLVPNPPGGAGLFSTLDIAACGATPAYTIIPVNPLAPTFTVANGQIAVGNPIGNGLIQIGAIAVPAVTTSFVYTVSCTPAPGFLLATPPRTITITFSPNAATGQCLLAPVATLPNTIAGPAC